jgi:NTP pyrophosphatase (non-canonical NTP hydrolase)
MDIRSGQKLAWQNKVAQEFNTTDVPLEFCLLQGEIAEAFDAWRKGHEDVGEELADVAIYLLGLAEMTGIDLQAEIEAKMAKNAARVYQRLPNGVLAKSSGEAEAIRSVMLPSSVDVFEEDPVFEASALGALAARF